MMGTSKFIFDYKDQFDLLVWLETLKGPSPSLFSIWTLSGLVFFQCLPRKGIRKQFYKSLNQHKYKRVNSTVYTQVL